MARSCRPAWVAVACALALLLTGCPDNGPVPDPDPEPSPSAYQIVYDYAYGAFMAYSANELSNEDLQRFVDASAGAETRDALTAAWGSIPALADLDAEFLERKIFDKAEGDRGWPAEPPGEKETFVKGTRDGATDRIAKGE